MARYEITACLVPDGDTFVLGIGKALTKDDAALVALLAPALKAMMTTRVPVRAWLDDERQSIEIKLADAPEESEARPSVTPKVFDALFT